LIFAHWQQFIASFFVACLILAFFAGLEDWWQRRKRDKEKK